ncbi:hypothetical protein MMC25_007984 [Agyrium rufum]|nr:hypothetical protein [Agyrium rufum]
MPDAQHVQRLADKDFRVPIGHFYPLDTLKWNKWKLQRPLIDWKTSPQREEDEPEEEFHFRVGEHYAEVLDESADCSSIINDDLYLLDFAGTSFSTNWRDYSRWASFGTGGRWEASTGIDPSRTDVGFKPLAKPHLLLIMHSITKARAELTRGEVLCILQGMTGRVKDKHTKVERRHSILLISIRVDGQARLLQGYYNLVEKKLIISCSNYVNLAEGREEDLDMMLLSTSLASSEPPTSISAQPITHSSSPATPKRTALGDTSNSNQIMRKVKLADSKESNNGEENQEGEISTGTGATMITA